MIQITTNNCALITPTFVGHLHFIENYLKSLDTYLKDKDISIYLTIEDIDVPLLMDITNKYPQLNIKVLSFEKLLANQGISEKPSELLSKYGRFSYQTLKKFYTISAIPEQYSLVVDSESMLIKNCALTEVFQNYFNAPFISYTLLSDRNKVDIFLQKIVENSAALLKSEQKAFYLENFVWFYDKKILKDLILAVGSPLKMVEDLFESGKKDLFEIQLYHQFIDLNNANYKYQVINIYERFKEKLEEKQFKKYKSKYEKLYKGNCGFVERVGCCVDQSNYQHIADILKSLNFNIIRSECYRNILLNNKTIDLISPYMLCASQDHSFGIKSNFKNKLMDYTDTRAELPRLYSIIHSFKHTKTVQFIYFSIKVAVNLFICPFKIILSFLHK